MKPVQADSRQSLQNGSSSPDQESGRKQSTPNPQPTATPPTRGYRPRTPIRPPVAPLAPKDDRPILTRPIGEFHTIAAAATILQVPEGRVKQAILNKVLETFRIKGAMLVCIPPHNADLIALAVANPRNSDYRHRPMASNLLTTLPS